MEHRFIDVSGVILNLDHIEQVDTAAQDGDGRVIVFFVSGESREFFEQDALDITRFFRPKKAE